ncbi:putative non-specific serine/threonine protein kinase [Helianthus annuus]|nr:putative non-specific serine/threonine protein kinase [Helianthus annuus]
MVLFEVLCARPVIHAGLRDEQVSLAEWGKTYHQKGTLIEIIDPKISGEIASWCLRKLGEVASKCLQEEGSERPAMEEVVWRLEFALQLQEDAEIMAKNQELSSIM